MSYLGLTPSEYSSGERRRLGGITKAGNRHARRVLVEAAKPIAIVSKVSEAIQARQQDLPRAVRDIAWKAQVRLCGRYRKLLARGKHPKHSHGRHRPGVSGVHVGDREGAAAGPRSQGSTTSLIDGQSN